MISTNSKVNVLIDGNGHTHLSGFGLASVIRGESSVASPQDLTTAIDVAWTAPEILNGGPVSKEGDIFTFGMVAVEVHRR